MHYWLFMNNLLRQGNAYDTLFRNNFQSHFQVPRQEKSMLSQNINLISEAEFNYLINILTERV
jgi:hypothetical protein